MFNRALLYCLQSASAATSSTSEGEDEEPLGTHSYSFSWCKCGHLVMGPEEEVLQPRRVPAKDLKNGGYVQLMGTEVVTQRPRSEAGMKYTCMPVLRCPWCGAFCNIEPMRMPVHNTELEQGRGETDLPPVKEATPSASAQRATSSSPVGDRVFLRPTTPKDASGQPDQRSLTPDPHEGGREQCKCYAK